MPHSPKKILIVPLDWGLGHTTRCIPIIRELLANNCEVHVGGTQTTNALLQAEFPHLQFHLFPSYKISYPKKGDSFLWKMFWQLPRISKAINKEWLRTRHLHNKHGYHTIISDNRFGVRNRFAQNIFISHQLNLEMPNSKSIELIVNIINRTYINQYQQVWVPDNEERVLSANLSRTKGIKIPVRYLGNLSRWQKLETSITLKNQILVILSGPEPQRSILESDMIHQANVCKFLLVIVRAKPNTTDNLKADNIIFYNHLSGSELQKLAEESAVVISRAGYSTIMDMVAIEKHAILIPTPGQSEQEYLAEHLANKKLFHFYNQENFTLNEAVKKYQLANWNEFPSFQNLLKKIIEEVIR